MKGIKRDSEKERDRESIYREYLPLKCYAKKSDKKISSSVKVYILHKMSNL